MKQNLKLKLIITRDTIAQEAVRLFYKMKTLIKILLLMSLTSCHPSGKEVAGKYCARQGKGIDCLELREDDTLKQFFKNDTTEKTNEGTWEFVTELKQEKLVLRNFMHYVELDSIREEYSIKGKTGTVHTYWSKDEIGGEDNKDYNYYRESR